MHCCCRSTKYCMLHGDLKIGMQICSHLYVFTRTFLHISTESWTYGVYYKDEITFHLHFLSIVYYVMIYIFKFCFLYLIVVENKRENIMWHGDDRKESSLRTPIGQCELFFKIPIFTTVLSIWEDIMMKAHSLFHPYFILRLTVRVHVTISGEIKVAEWLKLAWTSLREKRDSVFFSSFSCGSRSAPSRTPNGS